MKLATAYRQLRRDSEFLGLKFEDLIAFIAEAPLAQTLKTREASSVYKREVIDLVHAQS